MYRASYKMKKSTRRAVCRCLVNGIHLSDVEKEVQGPHHLSSCKMYTPEFDAEKTINARCSTVPVAPDETLAKEFEKVKHPKHYNVHPSGVECIEIIRHMNFNCGAAMKHIWRNGIKPGETAVTDLNKAIFYLNDEIERLKGVMFKERYRSE